MLMTSENETRTQPRDFRVLDYEYPQDVETVVRLEDVARVVSDESFRRRLEEISIQAVQV